MISDTGFYEFAKMFRGPGVDLSPMSVKMIRSARFSVALMPVMKQIGCYSIRISMRLRGAGYRGYSSKPTDINPKGFRHIFVAYSPSGICPLPIQVWLGFP